LIKKAAQ